MTTEQRSAPSPKFRTEKTMTTVRFIIRNGEKVLQQGILWSDSEGGCGSGWRDVPVEEE